MIGTVNRIIDSVIGVFSPSWEASRVRSRIVTRSLHGYEAGKRSETDDKFFGTSRSADQEIVDQIEAVTARARNLQRDNAFAVGAQEAKVRNVIGRGFQLTSGVLDENGKADQETSDLFEEIFWHWAEKADTTGELDFLALLELVYREFDTVGQCFLHKTTVADDETRLLPYAIELIETERLAREHFVEGQLANGNRVRSGIEFDSIGRKVAFYFYKNDPQYTDYIKAEYERVPAEDIIHLYRPKRIGQTQGISGYAPVMWWLRNLGIYTENEMQSSAIASCFGVAIETQSDDEFGIGQGGGTDKSGRRLSNIRPGMVVHLEPGEKVSPIQPSGRAAESQTWLGTMQRAIGVGTGINYERMSGDYSQTNFSSNRASDLETRRGFRPDQRLLTRKVCEVIYPDVITMAVANRPPEYDRLLPSADEFLSRKRSYLRQSWTPDGWEWTNPKDEVAADVEAINNHLLTLSEAHAKRGIDTADFFKQRLKELDMLKPIIEAQQSLIPPQGANDGQSGNTSQDPAQAGD